MDEASSTLAAASARMLPPPAPPESSLCPHTPPAGAASALDDPAASFADLAVDARLARAALKLGWTAPTLVQSAVIPVALRGRDMLVHARTGTGKTGAYGLPVLQHILATKSAAAGGASHVAALVLVPTKELSKQVCDDLTALCKYCGEHVRVVELSALAESVKQQKALLRDRPDVVVATPARVAARIADGSLDATHVRHLVVDEADLVLGFGYADDVAAVVAALPVTRQTYLMSATLGDEVRQLQTQALNRPALVTLEEEAPQDDLLHQLSLRAESESDKFLMLYVMLKLQLIHGKTLVFVNTVRQGYKLRLLLQTFFVQAGIVNDQLPENSRAHILQQFNDGAFSLLIATDEEHLLLDALATQPKKVGAKAKKEEERDQEQDEAREDAAVGSDSAPSLADKKRRKKDAEFGVSRGVDFKKVRNVINFDFPITADAYVHRIGRTARAGARGNAISFVCTDDESAVLAQAGELLGEGVAIEPFAFKMSAVEGFRYRVEDVLSTLSKNRIKDAQSLDLKQEIVRSQALKAHFDDNPKDLQVLLHDVNHYSHIKQPELKHIPDYLMPTAHDSAQIKRTLGRAAAASGLAQKPKGARKSGGGGGGRKRSDPLQSLAFGKARNPHDKKKRKAQ